MKVLVVTNVAAHYRQEFWSTVSADDDVQIVLIAGKSKAGIRAFQSKSTGVQMVACQNYYLSRHLVYQNFDFSILFEDWDAVVVSGEVQVLSSWIIIFICRLRRLKLVVWTHGLYGKESPILKWLRVRFYRCFNQLLIYNRRAKKLLIEEGVDESLIHVVYNSFGYETLSALAEEATSKDSGVFNLVFIGRLTPVKRLDLALEALGILQRRGVECQLHLIGDGSCRSELQELADGLGIGKLIHFYGAIHDVYESSQIIKRCHLGVSPGNIGLTAIHLLSLGVPVVTHDNICEQMPEVEIITKNVNGSFFRQGSAASLADAVMSWKAKYDQGNAPSLGDCRYEINQRYNPKFQARVFRQALSPLVTKGPEIES